MPLPPRSRSRRCAPPASGRGRVPPRARRCARCATCSSTARAWGFRTAPRPRVAARAPTSSGVPPGCWSTSMSTCSRAGGASSTGRAATRTAALHREDLDEVAEAYDGYAGPLKVQVAGPWTLAASLRLNRGERVVADPGAVADLVASLADGIRGYVADVRRLVPGAQVVLQLDEPSLPAVLEGSLPTSSGFGRVRAVDPTDVMRGVEAVLAGHDGDTVVHCCHPSAPLPLLRATGAGALAVDLTAATPARWESVAATLDAGTAVWVGCLPTDGRGTDTDARALVLEGFERAGLSSHALRGLVVSPTCGLAGLTPEAARSVVRTALDTARRLAEEVAS